MPQAIQASIPQPTSVQQAASALLRLINSSPRSPRQEEIEAILVRIGPVAQTEAPPISDLRIRLRDAMAGYDKALAAKSLGPEFKRAEAEQVAWGEEIAALEAEIPNPPRCYEDLIARAEIARHGGDVIDGKLMEAKDEEDVFLGPAGRLVDAVLQFGGASPAAMSPAHAEHHREWRRLIDHHVREFEEADETGLTKEEINAKEKRLGRHMETVSDLGELILDEPARTWGDVALYAQIFVWEGWYIDVEGPAARSWLQDGPQSEIDGDILAKLLEAIFTVAGVGHFAVGGRHG